MLFLRRQNIETNLKSKSVNSEIILQFTLGFKLYTEGEYKFSQTLELDEIVNRKCTVKTSALSNA
jgi:hypothetical protein